MRHNLICGAVLDTDAARCGPHTAPACHINETFRSLTKTNPGVHGHKHSKQHEMPPFTAMICTLSQHMRNDCSAMYDTLACR